MKGDWSQLPKELLGLIVERLILSDYIRFGAVCCSWRSVAASKHHRPATELPWFLLAADDYPFNDVNESHTKTRCHILSDDYPFNDVKEVHTKKGRRKEFYRPSEKKKLHEKRICGSFQGWLIMTDSITNYFLLNPLTRLQIPLPSWPSRSKELQSLPRYIFKAVMSASPSSPSCLVAAISCYGMAFCRPKGNTWTLFNDKAEYFHYQDLIFHKGALYAVNCFGELCIFELDEYPRCRTVIPPLNWYSITHLVECNGELLAVLRYVTSLEPLVHRVDRIGFQIYRADLGERKWVAVESLRDQVLFIQCKYSLEGFKGDCIYYKGWPKEEAKVNEIQTRRILHYTGRVFPRIWIVPPPWELEAES